MKLGVNGNYHAILYDGNTITNLENWASSSSPTAVNASGQVLGTIYTTSQAPTRAFIFDDGNLTLLGTLGGDRTWGYGLNDLGQVVGASQVSAGTWHAFLYQGGAMTDLGTSSWAYDINNAGTIVGGASNSPGSAFVYSQNQLELLGSVTNLGTTSFISLDEARSINDLGQIAGYGTTSSGARHAFLLTPVALTAVPEPETWTAIVGLILLAFSAKRLRAHAATSARR